MKILRNYVLKEVAGPFFISLAVFVFILLIGNLIQSAADIITRGVHILDILKLLASLIPYLLRYALPMSLLSAILLAFGRLSSDNEIMVMRASGVSLYKTIMPIIAVGLIISLFSIILNDRIIPRSHFASRKIAARIAVKSPLGIIEEGTFIRFANHIIFVNRVRGDRLEGIKIFQTQEGRNPRITVAREGTFVPVEEEGVIKLKLMDGSLDEPKSDNPNEFYQVRFKTYYTTLNLLEGQIDEIEKKPKDMTIAEAKQEIESLRRFNIEPINLIIEIHKKIALSFANLAFVVIGLPLAIKTKKNSRSGGFALSLVVIVFYYVLLAAGTALASRGVMSAALGVWLANIVLITIGILLIYRAIER
jgi:lipopolysaccharide export system permease protein